MEKPKHNLSFTNLSRNEIRAKLLKQIEYEQQNENSLIGKMKSYSLLQNFESYWKQLDILKAQNNGN